ncbi:MAG: glycogen/starch/alpha-glucan phosphorylase [Oligoflexia bacterium]|nr:glycogen/starch/alpha-glucan phosphorylase [Oligoflexia bacterium]
MSISNDQSNNNNIVTAEKIESFKKLFEERMERSLAVYLPKSSDRDRYKALGYAVRDLLISKWMKTQTTYYDQNPKRIYYLSMEFLLGRTLGNALINLNMEDTAIATLKAMGLDYKALEEMEWDAGLGNGGLGRLAACFLDSMATMNLPGYGYGIFYEFGMFKQEIQNDKQHETADTWLRYGYPFEIERNNEMYVVNFGGKVHSNKDSSGNIHYDWVDCEQIMAMAHDIPIPGYQTNNVNTLRLWSAKATREFNLKSFDASDYIGAVNEKNRTETISKVLYPNDNNEFGKELRLKQQFFMVSATIQDILRRFNNCGDAIDSFPKKVVIQLNDTHPTLAIVELMRIFLDEYELKWDKAFEIVQKTFAFTNHTILPEALEKWPVDMLARILPRHLQIIYDINAKFLDEVGISFPGDYKRIERMSIIEESSPRFVRMGHLAMVGSFSINGVAELHTKLLKERVFKDFFEMYPEKFNNKTNGITPRRWIRRCNKSLSELISSKIGSSWVCNLDELRKLEEFTNDSAFVSDWASVKIKNKESLALDLYDECLVKFDPASLLDVQVKRFHEYKRQLLNIFHCIHLYHQIKDNPTKNFVPRTVIFGGKAAPGYYMAKLIINLINSVSHIVNRDAKAKNLLKILFVPNYGVSWAEKIIPAANLSEQISTAGMEASGTSNMKFALNGALTMGTLDGANIEIMEEVGRDNIFIFGHTAEELARMGHTYDPHTFYNKDPDLRRIIDDIRDGYFNSNERDLFKPIVDSLMMYRDRFFLLADFRSYVETQELASRLYTNKDEWTKKSIINTARIGKFSSDRTIKEYVRDIWKVSPCAI